VFSSSVSKEGHSRAAAYGAASRYVTSATGVHALLQACGCIADSLDAQWIRMLLCYLPALKLNWCGRFRQTDMSGIHVLLTLLMATCNSTIRVSL
jgi:hypothetical protein